MTPISIQSSSGNYQVQFSLKTDDLITHFKNESKRVLLIVDEKVAALFPNVLNIKNEGILLVKSTEQLKTFPTGLQQIFDFLLEKSAKKDSCIIAIGGGIVQDIVTLCASLFHRGIDWHLVPTTLLSMGDSCIGAKSSINLGTTKNQIGNFYSPKSVFICSEFITTLKEIDIRSGLAEILKIGICSDQNYNSSLVKNQIWELNKLNYLELIHHSLSAKKKFIEEDEFDNGCRKKLNWGHTFGHAIEAVTNNTISHGYAVALGMDISSFFAFKQNLLDHSKYMELHSLLKKNYHYELPIEQSMLEDIVNTIKLDKKVSEGIVSLILLTNEGVKIHKFSSYTLISQIISEYIDTENLTIV